MRYKPTGWAQRAAHTTRLLPDFLPLSDQQPQGPILHHASCSQGHRSHPRGSELRAALSDTCNRQLRGGTGPARRRAPSGPSFRGPEAEGVRPRHGSCNHLFPSRIFSLLYEGLPTPWSKPAKLLALAACRGTERGSWMEPSGLPARGTAQGLSTSLSAGRGRFCQVLPSL